MRKTTVVAPAAAMVFAIAAAGCPRTAPGPTARADMRATPTATSSSGAPLQVRVQQVSAAGQHACALSDDGLVWCWGENNTGQVGTSCGETCPLPQKVALPDRATQIELSDAFSCALVVPGKRVCWGGPHGGSLVVDTRWQVARLALGRPESCVITAGRQLVCEGNNVMGRLGFPGGEESREKTAKPVPGLADVRDAFLGTDFGCAVVGRGPVLCWGNGMGCSGPSPMEGLGSISSVGGGDGFWCLVSADGNVTGVRGLFELGRGNPTCHGGTRDDAQLELLPMPVSGVLSASCHEAPRANAYEGCAVKRDGGVACWNERVATQPTAVAVPGVKDAIQVATSLGTSCAITRDHRLLCWGRNNVGQLGLGSTTATAPDAVVEPLLSR
jgi:alpha-tubulin suppressor-like RCC1 family protein